MCSVNEIELSHKMNHCVVPNFQMNDDYPNIPSALFTSKKSTIADEEIMELIWQNGQLIVQSQSQNHQRCMKKSNLFSDQFAEEESVAASAPLYMQEDEMNSWLQSPIDDDDPFADFLFTPPSSAAAVPPEEIHASTAEQIASSSPLPIIPQLRCSDGESTNRLQNFQYTRQNCAAVSSTASPAATAEQPLVETIASSSSLPIMPQLRCTEGESTNRLQNFQYTRQNCAAMTSAASPPGEIHASTAAQPSVETIASSSSRPIMPQLRCTEGESTNRLQNFQYSRQNCAAVSSAAAPPREIHASTAEPIIPQLRCTEGKSTHRLQNFQYTRQNCGAVSSAASTAGEIDTSSAVRQLIIPQLRCSEGELSHQLQNFGHFSPPNKAILRNCTSNSGHSVKASTVVESNETPIASVPEYMISRISDNVTSVSAAASTAEIRGGRGVMTACELMLTSSTTSGSGGSVSASAGPPLHPSRKEVHAAATAVEDRKRKSRESEDNEGQSEDVEFECADAKKQVRSSISAKKSRAAEVHNLSERKRRDRINEKMRALQELIPRCNKSDKASMLDEAIEYLKSLQLQVQMMSTGCSMVPMMHPGFPQYMPTMGMNMVMGMSMEMGMHRPMVPYPSLMPGPAMRNAAAAAQMAPRYPLPPYHLPPFRAPDPSRIPVANQPDPPRLNSLVGGHNTNQPRLPNFSDPYHQYFGLQQAQTDVPPESRSTGTAEQQ